MPELDGMEYVPLAVFPRGPPLHPAPPPDCEAAFAFTAPPYCWLDVGTPVHLHLARIPCIFSGPCRCPRVRPSEDPLAIRGWVVTERERTERKVEFVVKNEDPSAPIQHASVQFGPFPGILPPPNVADAALNRTYMRAGVVPIGSGRASGPDGPPGQRNNAPAAGRIWSSWGEPSGDGLSKPRRGRGPQDLGPMMMNLDHLRVPNRNGTLATQPYEMREVYGGMAMSPGAKAEADGIRNYGCPIVVRPSGRADEMRA